MNIVGWIGKVGILKVVMTDKGRLDSMFLELLPSIFFSKKRAVLFHVPNIYFKKGSMGKQSIPEVE